MKRIFPPKLFLVDIPFQILGLIRDWFEYFWRPHNTFTRQGYEFIPNFLDRAQCAHYIRLTNRYLEDYSYTIKGDCYSNEESLRQFSTINDDCYSSQEPNNRKTSIDQKSYHQVRVKADKKRPSRPK